MLQVHPYIRTSRNRPECGPELFIMNPYLDVFPAEKLVESAGVIEVHVS